MAITYDAPSNTITVTGYTEGSPCTFLDIWNADQAGGWGVVSKQSSIQFLFDAKLQIGDGTSGGQAWFADKDKQITFNDIVSSSSEILLYIRRYSHFTLGTLIDVDDKSTKEGCSVISLADPRCYLIRNQWAPQDTFLYGCSLHNGGAYIPYGTSRMYNCFVSKGGLRGPADGFNILLTDVSTAFAYTFPAAGKRFYIFNCTYLLYTHSTYNVIGREIYARGNTYIARFASNWSGTAYFINCDFDDWVFDWYSVTTGIVYRQYTFNLKVTEQDGTAISGATVTLKDKNDATVFSVSTAVDGTITEQTVSRGYYDQAHGDTLQDYSPHTLTIEKSGYQTYEKTFTLEQKTDWEIKLAKAVGVFLSFGSPVINLKKTDPENKNVMVVG